MQQKIIKHYGYENQLNKLVEELRELETVIINDPTNEDHIQEEMADVINLLGQIITHKDWFDNISLIKEFKINRQLKRIAKDLENQQ